MAKRQVITKIHPTDKMHIAVVKEGANQHADIILRKTKEDKNPTPTNQPEESVMDPKIIKALNGLSAEGRTYLDTLPDDQVEAWLAKSAEEREVDLTKAREAAKAKEEEIEKAKGGSPEIQELRKQLAQVTETQQTLVKENADLKKERRENELLTKAKTEFSLVPDALDILKSIDGLPDADKEVHLKSLASRQDLAKKVTREYGAPAVDPETSAATLVKTKVQELAKSRNISEAEATIAFNDDPANAELIDRALQEEAA
ncbi:hypothetical protein CPT_Sansa25 [Caulobacter phage Sansa]|uniref:Uncharacterized protein n=1 Tax=Caulobacter phage Sansa TaxID=1675600 RepID=A0A0K1LLV4_9CAUD|nr:hypothetical protein HOR07_gp025 [Caulobacter phage Sansa]AKU43429.1 hypothetical protein CPT_Sansa25 [Caulobacter phage Sansa]